MDDAARKQVLAFDEAVPVPPSTQRPFPGFWVSVAWILMYFGLQLLFGVIVLAFHFLTHKELLKKAVTGESPEVLQSQLMSQIGLPLIISVLISGLVTLAILWRHLRPEGRHEQIGLFSPSKMSLGRTILTGVVLMFGVGVLGELYGRYVVPGEELQAGITQLIGGIPKTPLNHLILFVTIAVIAPILEELLFRGYLQSALMRHMKPWMAIAVASAVFGAVHLQLLAFPLLAALGGVLGYLYYRTGSLKVNIILHMLNNSIAYALMAAGVTSAS